MRALERRRDAPVRLQSPRIAVFFDWVTDGPNVALDPAIARAPPPGSAERVEQ
jgi:hypothetical protein